MSKSLTIKVAPINANRPTLDHSTASNDFLSIAVWAIRSPNPHKAPNRFTNQIVAN